ncbi:hypothetical protein [Streptomyces sp. NBC_01768]|uniref:hypothetical protein n=1 Tax=Streptomyces sp. NBC_01768 TaxID=2975938 RepID=UPI003FA34A41
MATYHRTHGVRYFPGRCSIGGDTLWSVNHGKKSTASMPAAPKSNPCRPQLLAAVEADGGEGSDLRVRELTVAVGWDPVPSRTENLRSKAKRLAERGWVVADATGSRFMPRPRLTME